MRAFLPCGLCAGVACYLLRALRRFNGVGEAMFNVLRKPMVIVGSFVITIGLVFAFQAWMPSVGGEILDQTASLEESTALLASMTDDQKTSHFWMTLLLDYLFPTAYGAFFAGMALRFPGRLGILLAIPAFLVFGADVVENTVQLLALKGNDGLLVTKEFLTPAKFMLFNIAGVIALASLVWLCFQGLRSRLKRTSPG